MNEMNKYLAILCILICSQCIASTEFNQTDIGISFNYEDPMIFNFNPHSMKKTKIYLNGKHVGGFVVSVIPDGLTVNQFLSIGDGWYKEKYPGAEVTMSQKKNEYENQYYTFTARFKYKGVERLEEKFIFIKKRELGLGKSAFMTYTFTFLYPVEKLEFTRKILRMPIATMNFTENKDYFNYAIKEASGL